MKMMKTLFCFLFFVGSCLMENSMCGDHEYYDSCGTYCPPTCQVFMPDGCLDVCVPGCFCEEGYIRENLHGKCIPRNNCEGSCRDHEVYKGCGSPCPPTCSNPDSACAIAVCGNGCFCEDGYILDNSNDSQTCIKRDECPAPN